MRVVLAYLLGFLTAVLVGMALDKIGWEPPDA
jgi:hypothetical protein